MGSKGSRSHKAKHLPKVPKYEEPNTIGATGRGRSGHSSDHHQNKQPGPAGRFFLRLLGQRPKGG